MSSRLLVCCLSARRRRCLPPCGFLLGAFEAAAPAPRDCLLLSLFGSIEKPSLGSLVNLKLILRSQRWNYFKTNLLISFSYDQMTATRHDANKWRSQESCVLFVLHSPRKRDIGEVWFLTSHYAIHSARGNPMATNVERGTMNRGMSSEYDNANYLRGRAEPGLPSSSAKKLAKGLGWFSIGLGLAELLAPRAIANISGVSNRRTGLIRLYGLREIASGITIFAQEKPTEGVWSRVAGDAMDLTSLGMAASISKREEGKNCFRHCERARRHGVGRDVCDATEQRQSRHSRERLLRGESRAGRGLRVLAQLPELSAFHASR